MPRIACAECGRVLADEERRYYGHRCEECERDWSDRIDRWQRGGEDAELDATYDGPKWTVN